MADDETPWYRSLLVGVGAMLGVALLVGGLVAAMTLGAVSVSGIGDERVAVEEEPSLYIPEPTGSGSDEEDDTGPTLEDLTGIAPDEDESETAEGDPGEDVGRDGRKERTRPRQRSVISLSASPLDVSPMERIDLTGTYPGGEGATLEVQRFAGGWSSFSGVTASVSGETFSTYVMTGQGGTNRFRVVDSSSGKVSNAVRVRVG